MRLPTLFTASALVLVAGCASTSRPVAPAVPASNTIDESPSWASSVPQQDGDVQFSTPKAKVAADDQAPAAGLKMDSASSSDVKTTHLKAAQLKSQ